MSRPAGFKPFYESSMGVQWYRRENEGGTTSYSFDQDVQPLLDQNKDAANTNAGWMGKDKWGRRAASIPLTLWMKWLNEEGWDAFNPEHFDKLKQKLNDPDYRYLRTAEWTI